MSSSNVLRMAFLFALATGLAGCGNQPPPPHATEDTGITSSNGGGQRQLGNAPNLGISNGGTANTTRPRDPNKPAF